MRKSIISVLILILALAMVFAACETHQHTFDTEWSNDADNHWHKATCGDTDEVEDKAPHNMVPVSGANRLECDVCGYSKTTSNPEPDPEPHKHSFSTELSFDETNHWYAAICEHADEVKDLAKHIYVDGICKTCGWWSSATDVLFANLSKSDIWSYTLLLDDVVLNDVPAAYEEAATLTLTVSGELKLSMSADGQIGGCGYFQTDDISMKAVISNGMLYACGDNHFYRSSLSDLLAKIDVDVNAIEAYLTELDANTQAIREYVEQARSSMEGMTVTNEELQQLFAKLVTVDENKSTDQITVYVTDTAVLRDINKMLATVTVKEYVNGALKGLSNTPLGALLGDSFDSLPVRVRMLLTRKIGETLMELLGQGFTIDDLVNQLDKLVADYYPDANVNTVDELLAAMDVDLNGLTVKQMILSLIAFSPETLWNSMQQDNEAKISAVEIQEKLDEWCNTYGGKTVYEIMVAEYDELTAADVKALVDGVADLLDECVNVEFYVNGKGVLQQIDIVVTESDNTYDEPLNQLQQVFASINGTITLKRNFGSEQDYSKVIDQVNDYYKSLEQSASNA